jgi:DNA polymerase III subunit epsilon
MKLLEQPVLILDCQTTGMRPSTGQILEIGWSVFSPAQTEEPIIETFVVQLPEGEELASQIQAITGITAKDLESGVSEARMLERFRATVSKVGSVPLIAHYAQFERAFIDDLYLRNEIEKTFGFICTQRIGKRLFPNLPSQNIRGMAGFFGSKVGEFKRASSNVQATTEIWRAVAQKLADQDVRTFADLETWMSAKPKARKKEPVRYEYRMDRLSRLALSTKPGIYRMLAKDGRILYVGKATSLKSRVNSYFRGQKNRDRRKLEMLAQVWDLEVTECESPLEAALLETDEIKKWDPPYNVSLKTRNRQMVFYSRDFEIESHTQDEEHPLGPYRPMDGLFSLMLVEEWLSGDEPINIFYVETDDELMKEGFHIFWERSGLRKIRPLTFRELLAIALGQLRKFKRAHPGADIEAIFAEQKAAKEETEDLTAEDIAGKFERLFLRAAATNRRARTLTKLMNSKILIRDRVLKFMGGLVFDSTFSGLLQNKPTPKKFPWANTNIADFDRMSVLDSEVRKNRYAVEYL